MTHIANFLYGLVVSGVRAPKDDEHPDRILVDIVHRLFRVESILTLHTDRHEPALHIKIPSKLLKRDLSVRTHHNVGPGLVDALPCSFALSLPDLFHGETTELDGLGGSGGSGADGTLGMWSMPKVGEHGDAALVDLLCAKFTNVTLIL
jgi:hypothetical protein